MSHTFFQQQVSSSDSDMDDDLKMKKCQSVEQNTPKGFPSLSNSQKSKVSNPEWEMKMNMSMLGNDKQNSKNVRNAMLGPAYVKFTESIPMQEPETPKKASYKVQNRDTSTAMSMRLVNIKYRNNYKMKINEIIEQELTISN